MTPFTWFLLGLYIGTTVNLAILAQIIGEERKNNKKKSDKED